MKKLLLSCLISLIITPRIFSISIIEQQNQLIQFEKNRRQIKQNIQAIDNAQSMDEVEKLYNETQQLIKNTPRSQNEFAQILIGAVADAKRKISFCRQIVPIESQKHSITPPPSPEPHKRARINPPAVPTELPPAMLPAPPVPSQLPPALRPLPSAPKKPAPPVPSQLPPALLPAPEVPSQLPPEMQEMDIEESVEEITMPEAGQPMAQPSLLEQIRKGAPLKKVGPPQRTKIKPQAQKQLEEQMEKRQQQIDALINKLNTQEQQGETDTDSEWED